MTDPLSISLRPPVHYDRKADALQSVIPRINEQRGQFRNVTEASLEAEIQASQATGNDNVAEDHDLDNGLDDSEGKDADADADAQDRRDEIMAARGEIMRQIGQAYMEAYYALDFVSLLLSKETPRQAEISMSELLRKRVPLGSLGADRVQTRAQPEADIADGELISRGWKLQGLNSAADSLLRSASRLEKEIELETRYWEQVLTVGAKGWSLCRLPREKHTLGVRFGFAEATAAEFRDRGLAALRRSPSGSITLDQGLLDSRPRAIRVRIISSEGHSSAAAPSAIAAGDSSVVALTPLDATNPESLILQARNTLYEEELFHELTREARLLANLGVRPVDGGALAITLPSSGATQGEPSQTTTITIGLVALEPTAQPATSAPAEALALALRILLSHAHRLALQRRSQPPAPLTADRKRSAPPHALLRPVLACLYHVTALQSLRYHIQNLLVAPLLAAGLDGIDVDVDAFTNTKQSPTATSHAAATTTTAKAAGSAETGIEALLTPPTSKLILNLTTQQTQEVTRSRSDDNNNNHSHIDRLEITLRTTLPLTTEYRLSGDNTSSTRGSAVYFGSEMDLTTHLSHLIVQNLVAKIVSWTPVGLEAKADATNTTTTTTAATAAPVQGWKAAMGGAELVKTYATGRTKRLRIAVERGVLEVRWGWVGTPHGDVTGEGRASWTVDGGGSGDGGISGNEEGRSFRQVISDAGRLDA